MKTLFKLLNSTFYEYNVISETAKSYVVTYAKSDGEYEQCVRKCDENIKWFWNEEDAKAMVKKNQSIREEIEKLQNQLSL